MSLFNYTLVDKKEMQSLIRKNLELEAELSVKEKISEDTIKNLLKENKQLQVDLNYIHKEQDQLKEHLQNKELQISNQLQLISNVENANNLHQTEIKLLKQKLENELNTISIITSEKMDLQNTLELLKKQLNEQHLENENHQKLKKETSLLTQKKVSLSDKLAKQSIQCDLQKIQIEQLLEQLTALKEDYHQPSQNYQSPIGLKQLKTSINNPVKINKENLVEVNKDFKFKNRSLLSKLKSNEEDIEPPQEFTKIHEDIRKSKIEQINPTIKIEDVFKVAPSKKVNSQNFKITLPQESKKPIEQIKRQPKEKNIDKSQVNKVIEEAIHKSFGKTKENEKSPYPVSNKKFFNRNPEFELKHIEEIISIAKDRYISISPTTSRFAIRDRDEWQTDYATSYVNQIVESKNEEQRQELRRFMDRPYFARMDIESALKNGETLYITDNNSSISDYIISWKSEAASLFYLKTVGIPIQHKTLGNTKVDYIQQFSIQGGKITNFHKPLLSTNGDDAIDSNLIEKLNKKKGESMESIVSTIQKEQYEMISLPIDKPIIIQGSAGSGKSAIALHRLSYLLYQYKSLTSDSVAIIGPNETFLKYIKLVLPALGDFNVKQYTFITLASKVINIPKVIKIEQNIEVAKTKSSLSFSSLIEKYTKTKMNQLSNWKDSLVINGTTIKLMPVLEKMEENKHLTNKDRLNLYYNFFLSEYRKQIDVENQFIQQKQAVLDEVINLFVKDTFSLPSLNEELFINESITSKIMQLKDLIQFHKTSKTDLIKQLHQNITAEVTDYIINKSSKIKPSCLNEKLLDTVINQQWKFHLQEEITKEKDAYFKKLLISYQKKVSLKSIRKNTSLDLLLNRQGDKTLLKLEKSKTKLSDKWRIELIDFVINSAKYKIENELISSISKSFLAFVPKDYRLKIFNQFELKKLLKKTISDEDHKMIMNFVVERLEFNTLKFYKSLFLDFKEMSSISPYPVKITKEDIAPLLHVHRLLNGITPDNKFNYIIIDEAQDYMPYEIQEIRMLTNKNGIMLIGDLGQNINPISTLEKWDVYDKILDSPSQFELAATYRSTKPIVKLSNKIIEPYAKNRYKLSTIAYREGDPIHFVQYKTDAEESEKIIEVIESYLERQPINQVTVILKNESQIDKYVDIIDPYFTNQIQSANEKAENCKVILTTVEHAKGLEFETVIIVNFNAYEEIEYDRKLAYIATSRALHNLVIFYNENQNCELL